MTKPTSFSKRENEKKKQSKRLEKQKKKETRQAGGGGGSFEDMIAYVDENGVITDTPPNMEREEIDIETIAIATPKKTEETGASVLRGRVEHFNSSKGYGFIKDLATTEKYFFHISAAPANVAEGNTVTFELERGTRGMNAVNIEMEK